jgi:hypothetical protein
MKRVADVKEVFVYITHEGFVRAQDTPLADSVEHRRFIPAPTHRGCGSDCWLPAGHLGDHVLAGKG